jgi:hypothetical protein
MEALIALKARPDGVELLGTSISHAASLKVAMKEGLLAHLDVVQIPSTMAFAEPEMVLQLAADGKAVVVNSPVRKISKGSSPCEAFTALLAVPGVSIVLTGTRTHLPETIRYILPVKGVSIRAAGLDDAPAIRQLWLANHTPGGAFSLLPPPAEETICSLFMDLVSFVAVKEEDGSIVGFISANTATHPFNSAAPPLRRAQMVHSMEGKDGAQEGFLLGPVCVAQAYRRSGLFQRLHYQLRAAPQLCGREGVVMINLGNTPSLKAHLKLPRMQCVVESFHCEENDSNYRLFSFPCGPAAL